MRVPLKSITDAQATLTYNSDNTSVTDKYLCLICLPLFLCFSNGLRAEHEVL